MSSIGFQRLQRGRLFRFFVCFRSRVWDWVTEKSSVCEFIANTRRSALLPSNNTMLFKTPGDENPILLPLCPRYGRVRYWYRIFIDHNIHYIRLVMTGNSPFDWALLNLNYILIYRILTSHQRFEHKAITTTVIISRCQCEQNKSHTFLLTVRSSWAKNVKFK